MRSDMPDSAPCNRFLLHRRKQLRETLDVRIYSMQLFVVCRHRDECGAEPNFIHRDKSWSGSSSNSSTHTLQSSWSAENSRVFVWRYLFSCWCIMLHLFSKCKLSDDLFAMSGRLEQQEFCSTTAHLHAGCRQQESAVRPMKAIQSCWECFRGKQLPLHLFAVPETLKQYLEHHKAEDRNRLKIWSAKCHDFWHRHVDLLTASLYCNQRVVEVLHCETKNTTFLRGIVANISVGCNMTVSVRKNMGIVSDRHRVKGRSDTWLFFFFPFFDKSFWVHKMLP